MNKAMNIEQRNEGVLTQITGRMWRTNKFLTAATLLHLLLVGIALVGLLIDPRLVLNEPTWIKPLKFSMSIAVYCATIAWMLSYVKRPRWLVTLIGSGTALLLTGEMGLITLQAIRGVRSHFNYATPFDETVFSFMGAIIGTLWVLNLILAVLLLIQKFQRPVLKWSLVWGLTIAIIGGFMAFGMTEQTTAAQQEALNSGLVPPTRGGHTIGAEDGGPGLPLLGWSTTDGDLRVPHFLGLHGLQLIPLIGLVLEGFYQNRLTERRRLWFLFLTGSTYLGVVTTTYQQAIRGYSVVSFDPLTVLLLILMALFFTIGWVMIMRREPVASSGRFSEQYPSY